MQPQDPTTQPPQPAMPPTPTDPQQPQPAPTQVPGQEQAPLPTQPAPAPSAPEPFSADPHPMPETPMPHPAEPPTPTAPFPQPTPPTPAQSILSLLPASARRSGIMPFIVGGVAALVVVIVAVVLILANMNSIKLDTFSNNNFSVLVPADYQKTEQNGGASFEETKGDKNTHSEVIAFYQALPGSLTQKDIDTLRGTLRTTLQNAAETSANQDGEKVVNLKVSDITFQGDKALRLTGDAQRDGKKVGNYNLVAGVSTKGVYVVGVAAHNSDRALAKKADTIINSLKIK